MAAALGACLIAAAVGSAATGAFAAQGSAASPPASLGAPAPSGGIAADGRKGRKGARPSVWQQLRKGLARSGHGTSAEANAAVAAQIAWFRRHRPRLVVDTRLLALCMPHIVDAIARRGLPMEVALIPVVESGFDSRAESPRGALGVWQLMADTARDKGLRVDEGYDARLHLFEATHAALDVLEHNHRVDGDWLRSFAAYNAGLAKVRRAVGKNRAKGEPTDFWSLPLPEETRTYVPRLLAAAEIIRNPARHGFRLPSLHDTGQLVPLRPRSPSVRYELRALAEAVGWSASEAARLNPHVGETALHMASAPVLVPAAYVPGARRWLASPARTRRAAASDSAAVPSTWVDYRIARGDTLYGLARRHGVSVARLKAANGLQDSKIRYGRVLRVPPARKPRTTALLAN